MAVAAVQAWEGRHLTAQVVRGTYRGGRYARASRHMSHGPDRRLGMKEVTKADLFAPDDGGKDRTDAPLRS